ncbi:MAG: hypothetical protein KDD54_00540, partial [Flavobacteriales bacterium]|nr:hypothetical protein [Flavobacteriales bacterium]
MRKSKRIILVFILLLCNQIASAQSPPDLVPGLALWIRSDSVSLSNDTVNAIFDRSGNGHDLSQSNPANKPLYLSSVANINNHPSILFDGTNDFL